MNPLARAARASRELFQEFGAWRNASVDQRRQWAYSLEVARETTTSNRELVMKHPDLAERVRVLYRLGRAENWNGYVPPALRPANENNTVDVNRSPYRAELLEILAEAHRREAA